MFALIAALALTCDKVSPIFTSSEPVVFTLRETACSVVRPAKRLWTVADIHDAQVSSGAVEGSRLELSAEAFANRFGGFKLTVSGAGTNETPCSVWLVRLDGSYPRPTRWLGTQIAYASQSAERPVGRDYLEILSAAGIGVLRAGQGWSIGEKVKGQYELRPWFRKLLDDLDSRGIRLLYEMWATNPVYPDGGMDFDAFARWAGWTAKTLKDRGTVLTYEIWNEPQNLYFRKRYATNENDHVSWCPKFVDFTRRAVAAIRAEDPETPVSVCAEDVDWYLKMLLEQGIADGRNWVSLHPYSHKEIRPEGAMFFRDAGREYMEILASRGVKCGGFVISEDGWTTYQNSTNSYYAKWAGAYPPSTYEQQARYIVRSYVMAYQMGCKTMIQFTFTDRGKREYTEDNFGIVHQDFTPKPAVGAIAALARAVGQCLPQGDLSPVPDKARMYLFKDRESGRETVLAWWINGEGTVDLPSGMNMKTVSAKDMFGNPIPVPVHNGKLVLGENPVYVKGLDAHALMRMRKPKSGSKIVNLSLTVRGDKRDNPGFAILSEVGQHDSAECFRLAFNVKRERRVCAYYGGARIYSEPGVLDDGEEHSVAMDLEPGKAMRLIIDGKSVAEAFVPDRGLPPEGGWQSDPTWGERRVLGSADDAWYSHHFQGIRFVGRIDHVRLRDGAFDYAAQQVRWAKPKTTRRYLQGPKSERLLVFFREGRFLFGETHHDPEWKIDYYDGMVNSHAVWLVHGARDEPFDFRAAEMEKRADGIPVHAQVWRCGDLRFRLVAAAPCGRKPTLHARVEISNEGREPATESLALFVRDGNEQSLVAGAPDHYESYYPRFSAYRGLSAAGWGQTARGVGKYGRFVNPDQLDSWTWDPDSGAFRTTVCMQPGQSVCHDFSIGRGEWDGLDFQQAMVRTEKDWRNVLSSAVIPEKLRSDPETEAMARNFLVQLLQHLVMPKDGDYTMPRQGGLQRYVWPWESLPMLLALDRMGYAGDVGDVVDFYMSKTIRPDGEAGPFRNRWAADTPSVLRIFSEHVLLTGGRELWTRYHSVARSLYDWVCRRIEAGGGLFPAMKSTDHAASLRHWGMTDLLALKAIEVYARSLAWAGDATADEVARRAADYRSDIAKRISRFRNESSGTDEFRTPLTADGEDAAFLERFMFFSFPGRFAAMGFLDENEMLRLFNWLKRRGFSKDFGLTQQSLTVNMDRRDHEWYFTISEREWFLGWNRVGRPDLARQCLDACLKYAVTDEYYAGERYHDADPWYFPWSPNASAMGRIILMILESR